MPPRRREIELSVERPLGASDASRGVVRMTARWEPGPGGPSPEMAELRAALDELLRELDDLVGPLPPAAPDGPGRVDRSLAELVETYRPRQRELIDLLREEGELTVHEHELLATHLPASGAPSRASPEDRTEPATPARSAPAPAERGLPAARPVPELLRTYQISTLRQAGAVRARRQISFAEYMALKRHFEAADQVRPDEGRVPPRD